MTYKRTLIAVPGALLLTLAAAPLACARRPLSISVKVGESFASGYSNSNDFGFYGAYRFDRNFSLEAGFESLTGYETTYYSLAAKGSYPVTRRLSLFGKLGIARWKESPTGASGSSSTSPLWAVGLSWRISPAFSIGGEYQMLVNTNGQLGANINSLLAGMTFHF